MLLKNQKPTPRVGWGARQFRPTKNNEAGNSLNAIEREPVPTRVLNPNASEASYKRKQRSYRKTKVNKKTVGENTGGEKTAGKRLRGVVDQSTLQCDATAGGEK